MLPLVKGGGQKCSLFFVHLELVVRRARFHRLHYRLHYSLQVHIIIIFFFFFLFVLYCSRPLSNLFPPSVEFTCSYALLL